MPPIKHMTVVNTEVQKMRYAVRGGMLAFLLFVACSAVASSPAIGLAFSNGSLQVDNARVWGNTTIFDGNTIETSKAASDVKLNTGVQMRLASDSRAKVYQQYMVLEKGYGQVEASGGYEVQARSLRITPAAPHTVARVRLEGESTVMVAALTGLVRVTNSAGVVVAKQPAA